MTARRLAHKLLNVLVADLIAAAISCGIMSCLLQLRKTDLRHPFNYCGDALLCEAWVKGLLDNGWYLYNQFAGLPEIWHMEDFPMSESLHLFIMKVIGLFTHDHVNVINLHYLLTFPLIPFTSLFFFR